MIHVAAAGPGSCETPACPGPNQHAHATWPFNLFEFQNSYLPVGRVLYFFNRQPALFAQALEDSMIVKEVRCGSWRKLHELFANSHA